MRFQRPKHGDIKIITKFLIFPRRIDNEIRWLERVKLKYRYEVYYSSSGDNLSGWVLIKFLD